jgi:hypothetical protein
MRASETLAHTRAVQPVGTTTFRGVANGPPPRPFGTTSVTLERPAAVVLAAASGVEVRAAL